MIKIVKRIKKIRRSSLQEMRNLNRESHSALSIELSLQEADCMRLLESRGYCIIENYYTPQRCEDIKKEIDAIINQYGDRIWTDELGADHRIFGANNLSPLISEYFQDDFIRRIIFSYQRSDNVAGFTMANKLVVKEGNLGSGQGWHRDSASRKQTKSILYLSDVVPENGPFQYIEGSHTSSSVWKDTVLRDFKFNQNRFSEKEVGGLLRNAPDRLKTVTGKAGSLLIADTRGIHRGQPITKESRYALTNYLWFDKPIPKHIQPLILN